jgi:hypothetical protein
MATVSLTRSYQCSIKEVGGPIGDRGAPGRSDETALRRPEAQEFRSLKLPPNCPFESAPVLWGGEPTGGVPLTFRLSVACHMGHKREAFTLCARKGTMEREWGNQVPASPAWVQQSQVRGVVPGNEHIAGDS